MAEEEIRFHPHPHPIQKIIELRASLQKVNIK
jgi:hypothetical protein